MALLRALCRLLLFNLVIVKGYLSNSPHIITFWGQDPSIKDADNVVRALNKTCGKSSYTTVVIGFVNKSFKNKTTASLPPMHCIKSKRSKTKLSLYCPEIAKKVEQCQKNNRKVLIGVGGPNETLYFDDANSAQYFAKKIWNWFLGGTEVSEMRPFGGIKLDGVNLFLKDSGSKHLDIFLRTLDELSSVQPGAKYTYTMSVPCNNPDLYFGEGNSKLSKDKIVPLIKQIYVRYAGKPCCKDGPKHFRGELHEWKGFSADPNRPELFVLFPRNPHTTMTNCFSSPRQLSILNNVVNLKSKLANVISQIESLYLKNERSRALNLTDAVKSALERDTIGRLNNIDMNDPLLPLKRLFTNPKFTALYRKMNDLETKINDKEDAFLFDSHRGGTGNTKRQLLERRGDSKHGMVSNLFSQIENHSDADKKSLIRLVVDIFTDSNHKAALSKFNVIDNIDANVEGMSKKEDKAYFQKKNGSVIASSNDMEVAGNDDIVKEFQPPIMKYALNDSVPEIILNSKKATDYPIPMLYDNWVQIDEDIPYPKSKNAKYENSLGRSLPNSTRSREETMGTASSDQSDQKGSKSVITLDNDLLDPENMVEITEGKDKLVNLKQKKEYNLLDEMFVSDVENNDIRNADMIANQFNVNTSHVADQTTQSFEENDSGKNGDQKKYMTRSDIKVMDNKSTPSILGSESKLETAGVVNEHELKEAQEIKLSINLLGAAKSKPDERISESLSFANAKKHLQPKIDNDSSEMLTSNVEFGDDQRGTQSKTQTKTGRLKRRHKHQLPKGGSGSDDSNKISYAGETRKLSIPGSSHGYGNFQDKESGKIRHRRKRIHHTKKKRKKRHKLRKKAVDTKSVGDTSTYGNIFPKYSINKTLLKEAKKRFTENIYKTLSRFIPDEYNPLKFAEPSNFFSKNDNDDFASSDSDSLPTSDQNSRLQPVTEQDNLPPATYLKDPQYSGESKRESVKSGSNNKKIRHKHHSKSNMALAAMNNRMISKDSSDTNNDIFERKIGWLKKELRKIKHKNKIQEYVAGRHEKKMIGGIPTKPIKSKNNYVLDEKTKHHPINTWYFDSLFSRTYEDLKKKLRKLGRLKQKGINKASIKLMIRKIDWEINDLSQKAESHAAQGLIKEPAHTAGTFGNLEIGPVADHYENMDNEREDEKIRQKSRKAGKRGSPLKGNHLFLGTDTSKHKSKIKDQDEEPSQKNHRTKGAIKDKAKSVNNPHSYDELHSNNKYSISGASISASPLNSSTTSPSSSSVSSQSSNFSNIHEEEAGLLSRPISYLDTNSKPPISPGTTNSPAAYGKDNSMTSDNLNVNPNTFPSLIPENTNPSTESRIDLNQFRGSYSSDQSQGDWKSANINENRGAGPLISTNSNSDKNAASNPSLLSSANHNAAAANKAGNFLTYNYPAAAQASSSKPVNADTIADANIRAEALNNLNSERDPHITAEAMSYLNTDGLIDAHPPFDQKVTIGTNRDDSEEDPYLYSNHDAVIDFNYLNDTNYHKQPYAYSNSHATIDFPRGKRSNGNSDSSLEIKAPSKQRRSANASLVRDRVEGVKKNRYLNTDLSKTVKLDSVLLQFSKMFPPVLYPFAELGHKKFMNESEKHSET